MRRLTLLSLLISALVAGGAFVGAAPASAQLPPDDPARGLVHAGLRAPGPDSPCRGLLEVAGTDPPTCTHGPDPAPPGVDVRTRRDATQVARQAESPAAGTASGAAAATPGIQCYGTGADGNRVQLVFAHAIDKPDRFAQFSAQFAQTAADVDAVVNASAAETGGVRHIRFVTDAGCNVVISSATLTATGDDSLTNTKTELKNLGYNHLDRKYLVWVDANVYCGIADVFLDDSPLASNANNNDGFNGPEFARVDNGCWSATGQLLEAHELTHTLGAVQNSAPHSTGNLHCKDDFDRMCYDDGPPPVAVQQVCGLAHENRLDCRHDDYFSTNPPGGNYLTTHWNTASSSFLSSVGPAAPTPTHGATADLDGDGTTNPAIFRPSAGIWYYKSAPSGYFYASWGANGDTPIAGDYDADHATDLAVVRPSTATWFIKGSGNFMVNAIVYGIGTDVPVPADYDGDGGTDIAIFRASTATWWVHRGVDGIDQATTFGINTDIPVPADYDGDGKADIAVFRPSTDRAVVPAPVVLRRRNAELRHQR